MTADVPVLDPAQFADLLESVGGDIEFVAELATTFFTEADALMKSIEEGIAADDVELVRRAAHTLKSTSNSLALTALSEVGARLEGLARRGTLAGARDLLAAIHQRYPEARAALEARAGLV